MSFDDLRARFQAHFDFPIALPRPYKLCDYRPAYGEMFSDFLGNYDFWGHCDVDQLWGDIRKFITTPILETYKRVYPIGSCALFRNTPEVNAWYRTLPTKKYQKWDRVFSDEHSRCFDEWGAHAGGGIPYIILENGIEIYDAVNYADMSASHGDFSFDGFDGKYLRPDKGLYFHYKRGHVYVCKDGEAPLEVLYMHFCGRRRPVLDTNLSLDGDVYFLPPNLFTSDPRQIGRSRWLAKKRLEMPELYKRWKWLLKRWLDGSYKEALAQ